LRRLIPPGFVTMFVGQFLESAHGRIDDGRPADDAGFSRQ
jgi:hypothetical protein